MVSGAVAKGFAGGAHRVAGCRAARHHDEEDVDGECEVVSCGGSVGLGLEAKAEEGDGDEYAPHELHHGARAEGDGHGDEGELPTDLKQLPPEDVRLVRLVHRQGW